MIKYHKFNIRTAIVFVFIALLQLPEISFGQDVLTLKDALKIGTENYGVIKAKEKYAQASQAAVKQTRIDYLPNVYLSAQADLGTVNGQTGPSYSNNGLSLTSSGVALPNQNWNAAFGSVMLTGINWDVFTFGKINTKVKQAVTVAERDELDRSQEVFEHQIRVASAYLNLLAAQRLTESYRENLDRADSLRKLIAVKAKNDLVAGVDSSQATAEVSNARSILLKSLDYQDEQAKNLVIDLGIQDSTLKLDTLFINRLPGSLTSAGTALGQHPLLKFYESRITVSEAQSAYYKTLSYPTVSFTGIFQARGSGFGQNYASNQSYYSDNFYHGITPDRENYLIGIGITWNLTEPFRVRHLVRSQQLITSGLKDEYDLVHEQLVAQGVLAEKKITHAVADYYEVPKQLKAAEDAYRQKTILYKNGLTTLVDVVQSLYVLERAETDRDIAYTNVWEALLLRAASAGDFSIFYKNL